MIKDIIKNDPEIYTINNFITEGECNHFINIAKDKIQIAYVCGDKEGFISSGRTGKNCWININTDNITKNVADKISKLIEIPIEQAESFQVIYYDINQEYRNHYDGWLFDNTDKSKRNLKNGQRIKTVLVYLNDVITGGGTKFTKLNIEIKAEKGKLLMFDNVYKNTNIRHELSEHAGLPVVEGEKWAFNLWFRENIKEEEQEEEKEKEQEEEQEKEQEEKQSFLEKEDFFPFIKVGNKEIHNLVNDKFTIIINTIGKYNLTDIIHNKYNVIIRNISDNLKIIPDPNENIYILLLSPNKRIKEIFQNINNNYIKQLEELDLSQYYDYNSIPYIIIENVLDNKLFNDLIDYYSKNINKVILNKTKTKDREHIHTNKLLTDIIDNKLSRTVFPEVKKIYNYDIKFREDYKICNYASSSSGRFHQHRDTPHPHNHRKFAMSLLLNDDYEGGELYFPEYNIKLKPKKNTAVIFPGILSHGILDVTKGNRMSLITFFTTKEAESYKITNDFFDGITYSNVYPNN